MGRNARRKKEHKKLLQLSPEVSNPNTPRESKLNILGYSKYFLIPLGLSLLAGIIYLYTAAPSMAWVDALDVVDASVNFGINLPPAPLYVIIAHFFTLLPFGSVIFRLQFFSALLAAASLFLLYRIIVWTAEQMVGSKTITSKNKQLLNVSEKNGERTIIVSGIFGVLALAFSYEFWSQAQNTEKWTLESVLELFILYLVTVVLDSRRKPFPLLYAVFFLFGLSTGTDSVVLSFFPSVLLVLLEKRQELNIQKLLLLALTGLAGVILVYSSLPIMASHNPFLNFRRATSLPAVWALMIGQGQNVSNNGFTGSVNVYISSSWHFIYMLWVSFTPFLLPFMLLGGWHLWKKQKRMFWLLFLIIPTNFILSVLYLSGNQEAWYLLPDVSFAIFAVAGYLWLTRKLSKQWYALLFLLISLAPLVYWWTGLDRHTWRITDDYIHNLYSPLTEPAILFGASQGIGNDSYYVHDVIKYRPAVIPVLHKNIYSLTSYWQNLLATTHIQFPEITKYYPPSADGYSAFVNDFFAMNLSKYKIYIDFTALNIMYPELSRPDGSASFKLDTNPFKFVPSGLVEEVVPKESKEQSDLADFNYQFSNGFPDKKPTVV